MTVEGTDTIHLDHLGGPDGAEVLRAALVAASVTDRAFSAAPEAGHSWSESERRALAAAETLGSQVVHADGSVEVTGRRPKAGQFTLAGGATSAVSLLQQAALPLALSSGPSRLRLTGLTHSTEPDAFPTLAFGWAPLAERIGLVSEISLDSAGLGPDSEGLISARVFPAPRLNGLELQQRGLLQEVRALVSVAGLGIDATRRGERRLSERLRPLGIAPMLEALPLPVEKGQGGAIALVVQFEHLRVTFGAPIGDGVTIEDAADRAVEQLRNYMRSRGALTPDLAHRLLIPMAVASSSFGAPGAIRADQRPASRVTVAEVTPLLLRIADVARKFLDVQVRILGFPGSDGVLDVRPNQPEQASAPKA